MALIAVVSQSRDIRESLSLSLKGHVAYQIEDYRSFEDARARYEFDLFVIDAHSLSRSQGENLMREIGLQPVIVVAEDDKDLLTTGEFRLTVRPEEMHKEVPVFVDILLAAHQKQKTRAASPWENNAATHHGDQGATHEREAPHLNKYLLSGVAEILTVSFDIDRLVNRFIALLSNISQPGRVAVMLRQDNEFVVRGQRGMDPALAKVIRFDLRKAIAMALAREGRILKREGRDDEIGRELGMLQSEVAFPMVHRGKLEGILLLSGKITGGPYSNEELEIIYMLCNYLAAMIADFRLHHKIREQGDFINKILDNMNSGVATIDREEKVRILNKRACEILSLGQDAVIGKDLRTLPSPLGDILYATMKDGKPYLRHEVTVGPRKLHLGVTSYSVTDDTGERSGAGIVFNDITVEKKLDEERRNADRFRLMNILSGRIAHEIKNPLSAIQTFTQLLGTKFDDREFREYYADTVIPSIRRLNNLIEKIVVFSSPPDYNSEPVDISQTLSSAVAKINEESRDVRIIYTDTPKVTTVIGDREILRKGFYYLFTMCADHTRKGDSISLNVEESSENSVTLRFAFTPDSEDSLRSELRDERDLLDRDTLGGWFDIFVVRRIIEEHCGTLTTNLKAGSAEITITLPAAFAEQEDPWSQV